MSWKLEGRRCCSSVTRAKETTPQCDTCRETFRFILTHSVSLFIAVDLDHSRIIKSVSRSRAFFLSPFLFTRALRHLEIANTSRLFLVSPLQCGVISVIIIDYIKISSMQNSTFLTIKIHFFSILTIRLFYEFQIYFFWLSFSCKIVHSDNVFSGVLRKIVKRNSVDSISMIFNRIVCMSQNIQFLLSPDVFFSFLVFRYSRENTL